MSRGKVVVTGAGGFVCSEIICALARAGFEPIAVDRSFQAAFAERLAGLCRVTGAIPEVLSELQEAAPLAVIHGAALTTVPDRLGITKADHVALNSELLTATLRWARQNGAAKFVFLSSMGVFGPSDGPPQNGLLTEMARPSRIDAYGAAKRAGELLTSASAEVEFQTLSIRLGNVFGPHETARDSRQVLSLISRLVANAQCHDLIKLETPHAPREWCWLPDLADCIVNLIAEPFSQIGAVIHAGTPPIIEDLALARAVSMRVGNPQISFSPEPHALVRAPMGHSIASAFDRLTWTPIALALDQLIPERTLQ